MVQCRASNPPNVNESIDLTLQEQSTPPARTDERGLALSSGLPLEPLTGRRAPEHLRPVDGEPAVLHQLLEVRVNKNVVAGAEQLVQVVHFQLGTVPFALTHARLGHTSDGLVVAGEGVALLGSIFLIERKPKDTELGGLEVLQDVV
eukprot:4784235-Prymnesium_polylepis.1